MILYTYSLVSQVSDIRHARTCTFFESLEEARQTVHVLRNEVMQDGAEWTPVRIETVEIPPIVTSRSLVRLLNDGILTLVQRHEAAETLA